VRCSFVVSAFNRPRHLACLLRSLQVQSERDFEVIVTDNARDRELAAQNASAVDQLDDPRFHYEYAGLPDCYLSANHGAELAVGEYLCFPSDDNYYVPRFLEEMLRQAPADLLYCDCIYDGNGARYALMDVAPSLGRIDKGGFLVRNARFSGFEAFPAGATRPADGWLVEELVRGGISHAKAPGYLWIHN
jgi:glycosyltransferase involved in cell wall biosynthesis